MDNKKYTKRDIMESILASWERCPNLRLGQLICNAVNSPRGQLDSDLFYMKDDKLAGEIEKYDLKQVVDNTISKYPESTDMKLGELALLILNYLKETGHEGRFSYGQIIDFLDVYFQVE